MIRTLTFLAAFPLAALAVDQVATLREELRAVDTIHPEADAARDLAAQKPRCFSVNGYGTFFPSVDSEEDQRYCNRHEQNFRGTSDDVSSAEHHKLVNEAIAYAEVYNRYVLTHRTEP